ncbi:LysE family translocator [Actinoplanes sp. TRM 88003]|uniref:LysE family translocator n=1 Tax=Paractinoplanes aksuensis TaxID=2939490 RepID=A0ABT1DKA3_9ACTN|nr:LysE family translocator [Actinoplanes aksuensis]MCO8270206.1 LysE family translocator [Actinoplanes aksuensis]
MPTHLAAFVVTVALLAVLPGANNASITRQTLTYGRRAGLAAVAGSSTGILVWAVAAATGLSAVLLANPGAYQILRLAGAAVLIVLGLLTLFVPGRPVEVRRRGSFLAGLFTSLGNPKAGVVAVSLIPQFVTADGPVLLSSIALGVVWAAVSGSWFMVYVWMVDRGRARVTRPVARKIVRTATGMTMLGLGVAVAIAG